MIEQVVIIIILSVPMPDSPRAANALCKEAVKMALNPSFQYPITVNCKFSPKAVKVSI